MWPLPPAASDPLLSLAHQTKTLQLLLVWCFAPVQLATYMQSSSHSGQRMPSPLLCGPWGLCCLVSLKSSAGGPADTQLHNCLSSRRLKVLFEYRHYCTLLQQVDEVPWPSCGVRMTPTNAPARKLCLTLLLAASTPPDCTLYSPHPQATALIGTVERRAWSTR